MRAQRYRLRFVPGVSTTAATYGSDTYGGSQTYGLRASDPITAYRYRVVPLPAGYPSSPAWMRRTADLKPPLRAQILSDQGPLNLSAVTTVWFVFTAIDGRDEEWEVVGYVDDVNAGIVAYNWESSLYGDATYGGPITYGNRDIDPPLIGAGVYRVLIVLAMASGRRLSVPDDDNLRLHVFPVGGHFAY